jgi:hypothetical protein
MFDVDAKKPRLAIGRGLVNAEKIMRGASIWKTMVLLHRDRRLSPKSSLSWRL